jgi:NADH-quinone oxidoreductase subunit C
MTPQEIHDRLAKGFADKITGATLEGPSPWSVVAADAIADVATFCKSEADLLFDNLMNLGAVDYPKETPPRFEVVYHLFSYKHRHKHALKVFLPRDNPELHTVEDCWGVANWHEREAFDMFGIRFLGHSDLRRILLPDDWEGHPLRKDWVDPEFYNGLRVKPTPQMAERAMGGEQIGVGPFNFTPPNRHVG